MANLDDKKKKEDNPISKPDPETLHKTDPQDNMEGPVSSIMQNIKEEVEENDDEKDDQEKEKKDK